MDRSKDEPVYVISIAAKLVNMHPQTLRLYERMGLIKPHRIDRNRLYSERDIERLKQIQRLTQDLGVNLAGVDVVLNLLEQFDQLRIEMESRIQDMEQEMEIRRNPEWTNSQLPIPTQNESTLARRDLLTELLRKRSIRGQKQFRRED